MYVDIEWAMPSRFTFSIPPIKEFVERHLAGCKVIVDPFCGNSKYASISNDIAHGGVPAVEFLDGLVGKGVKADALLFDPPYSPRQISECYKAAGRKCGTEDTQNGKLYKDCRMRIEEIVKPGGVVLSFGWQSAGMGKKWKTVAMLIVQHGGAHNDTICVAQVKR